MTPRRLLPALVLAVSVFFSVSCVTPPPPECTPCQNVPQAPVPGTPAPETPAATPVVPAPETRPTPPRDVVQAARLKPARFAQLPGWQADQIEAAWPALLRSCDVLVADRRWTDVCTVATTLGAQPGRAAVRQFFETRFAPWQVVNGDGSTHGMVTGYYEPLIRGSLKRSAFTASLTIW